MDLRWRWSKDGDGAKMGMEMEQRWRWAPDGAQIEMGPEMG